MTLPVDLKEKPVRRRLTGKLLVGLALGGLILLRAVIAFVPKPLHISAQTTVIDSPLRDDGTPDYEVYLNDVWSEGVTVENNAAVILIEVFGSEIIDADVREAYFKRLGIPDPGGTGSYQEYREFLVSKGVLKRDDERRWWRIAEPIRHTDSEAWTAEDHPRLAAWLKSQQPAIAQIVAASKCSRFYSPLLAPPNQSFVFSKLVLGSDLRRVVRMVMRQAMFELGRGDLDRACELTLVCHRLSRLQSQGTLPIGLRVSYAVDDVAYEGEQAIVVSGKLSRAQAIAYRKQLSALPPFRILAEVIDREERLTSLDFAIAYESGRIPKDVIRLRLGSIVDAPSALVQRGLDLNSILRRLNRQCDELVAAIALPDRADRMRALRVVYRRYYWPERPVSVQEMVSFAAGTRSYFSERVGHILLSNGLGFLTGSVDDEEEARTRLLLTDVGYALAAYKAERGDFPDTLDALVPDLLPAVPLDPINGDPLKYSLKEGGFLLYSVGTNGVDDGGRTRRRADDVAFGITPEASGDE